MIHTSTSSREYNQANLLLNGKVLISGGGSSKGYVANYSLFDPILNSFESPIDMIDSRTNHTATLLNDGRVFIIGGEGSYGLLSFPEFLVP